MPPTTAPAETVTKNNPPAKITLYWLEKSRSQRILWLLEELKVQYELKTYKREKMLAPAELKEVHPLGKSPIISIETEEMPKPLILAESGPIVEYLTDHFNPGLTPTRYQAGKEGQIGGETEEWLRYRYLMHYVEGSLMILMVVAIIARNIGGPSVPFFIRPIAGMIAGRIESLFLTPNFETHFEFLESQIATSPHNGDFLCGKDLTGADVLMSFPLGAARGRAGLTQEKYPKLWAYIDRLESREAFKRAVQKIIEVDGCYDPTL